MLLAGSLHNLYEFLYAVVSPSAPIICRNGSTSLVSTESTVKYRDTQHKGSPQTIPFGPRCGGRRMSRIMSTWAC